MGIEPGNNKNSDFKSLSVDEIFRETGMRKKKIAPRIVEILQDGVPRTTGELAKLIGVKSKNLHDSIKALFKRGVVLRSKEYFRATNRINKGRAGVRYNNRWFYLWKINDGKFFVNNIEFVTYDKAPKDKRGTKQSVAKRILNFLMTHSDSAFFSSEIAAALNIKSSYVMGNIRRLERKGLVLVRGYRRYDQETPFQHGFLITYIKQSINREEALREAIERINKRLVEADTEVLRNIRMIRDIIFTESQRNRLVNLDFLVNKLKMHRDRVRKYVERAFQLYSDLRKVKLFDLFAYYYHESIPNLEKAIEIEEKIIRHSFSKRNRMGHNFEAAVTWFIDRFTTGAKFWTQNHRTGMNSRRITTYLIKPVNKRNRGEFDRVWEIRPNPFSPPIIYVLECKFGYVSKKDIDYFFEKLRWSKDFGADTEDGRVLKQGVVGMFAGTTFNPREKITIDGNEISLAQYAARLNINLIRAADLNKRLHERGIPQRITIQMICKYCRNEKQVTEVLDKIWENPKDAERILKELIEQNKEIFEFEKKLEEKEQ